MKSILIIVLISIFIQACIVGAFAAKYVTKRREPQLAFQVIVTQMHPYKVYPYTLISCGEVDSMLIRNYGPAFNNFSIAKLLKRTNHFYTQIENLSIEIERKEIKDIRKGEVILRRRKLDEIKYYEN